jgi:hypothetical protein
MIIAGLIFYLIFIFPVYYNLWQKEYKKLDEEFNKYMQEKNLKNEIKIQ